MNSREKVRKVLQHEETGEVPWDLDSTPVTGIHSSSCALLHELYGHGGEIRVWEPFQMLGRVEPELREKLGIDTVGLALPDTFFGFKNNTGWKPWNLPDGTPVLVPKGFRASRDEEGNHYLHPQGDTSVPPSGKMPRDGYYFDLLVRQEELEGNTLRAEDWVEGMYGVLEDEELEYLHRTSRHYYDNTNYSLVGNFVNASFGDFAWIPGPHLKNPRGIRDPKEWYIAHITRPEYIREIFARQCEIAIKNLELAYEAVGDRLDVIMVSGTDFGTQSGLFISPNLYRELYKPFHKKVNDWIHEHTSWKVFFHTCGAIAPLLDDLVEAGVDILNPVQTSAEGMSPTYLQEHYGEKLVFWGGGIDTQKTLPFGSPEEIKREVRERINTFRKGGGFVFSTIHNIQPRVPAENLEALFAAVQQFR